MQKLISLLAAVVAALSMIGVASAQQYKLVMCNAKQSAKVELHCAQRNIWHAKGTLRWVAHQRSLALSLPINPNAGFKLARIQRNMTWLLAESLRDKTEAKRRMIATIPAVNDWTTAVALVQRAYPGTSGWLMSCSSSEGGHGGFVWIGHASSPPYGDQKTPGGWLQYMQRTFWGDFHAAVQDATSRGITVPRSAWSYYSPLGQALAGAWAVGHKGTGQWTGALC